MGTPLRGVAAAAPARLPEWARKSGPLARQARGVRVLLREGALHTVCEEARCPNLGECFGRGTATFLLLGDRCTRRCRYCAVSTARPLPPDPGEPERVAEAARRLGLRYVVLTSVVHRYVRPESFRAFEERARAIGFPTVYSGVFVRSSFNAEAVYGDRGSR